MIPSSDSLPRLAPGCRINDKKENPRLLIKGDKSLRLHGPSLEIVERCDGRRTVKQIVSDLQLLYSKAEPQRVEQDVLSYLSLLATQNYLDL
jgi:Coenzyme PQQ synthesis protein D (PqqD)